MLCGARKLHATERTNRLGNYEPINIGFKPVAQATDKNIEIL